MINETVPEGFQKTEVGIIPNDWSVKTLFEVLKVKHGKSQKEVANAKGEYPILASGGVIGRAKEFLYDKPSVLIGRKGTIDKPQLMTTPFWSVDTLFYTEIFDGNSAEFIFYNFLLIDWYSYNEASGVPSLNARTIEQIKIPLPPTKGEQTAIANALNDADELITRLEQLIAKKRLIKQGAMQELLKPKGDWEVKKLGEVGECIIGLTYSPRNISTEGKLVLRSSNIFNNKLVYNDNVFVNVKISERLITKNGDILICVRNGSRNLIGKCAYINGKGVGETFGAFMSIFRSSYNDFIFHVFQSNIIQRQIEETIGATINQLTNKNLNAFEIPFPNTSEQTRIAQILSDMDAEIVALETKLAKYKMLKQGMMQNLLTGKIRLV
jgi:type I restriction enzyme S subunit